MDKRYALPLVLLASLLHGGCASHRERAGSARSHLRDSMVTMADEGLLHRAMSKEEGWREAWVWETDYSAPDSLGRQHPTSTRRAILRGGKRVERADTTAATASLRSVRAREETASLRSEERAPAHRLSPRRILPLTALIVAAIAAFRHQWREKR